LGIKNKCEKGSSYVLNVANLEGANGDTEGTFPLMIHEIRGEGGGVEKEDPQHSPLLWDSGHDSREALSSQ